jgi:hypothetical protein
MKRPLFALTLIAVALAGFILGRATAGTPLSDAIDVRREIPLFPAPPKDEGPAPSEDGPDDETADILVELPTEGAIVSAAFLDVAGRARADGKAIVIVVRSEDGTVIASTSAPVQAAEGDEFGRFAATLTFDDQPTGSARVEISRQTGPGAEPVVRNVTFAEPDTVAVKAYFAHSTLGDPLRCDQAFPVERRVSSNTQIYRAAIEALLRGPTAEEKGQGYVTSIPDRVKLKSIAADAEGTVTADFSAELDRGVAGSCRVQAIRAQIETTLKQFPEVRDVIISVEGEVEEALQP